LPLETLLGFPKIPGSSSLRVLNFLLSVLSSAVAENQPVKIKNRMTSDLSIFGARLREFISICVEELSLVVPASGASAANAALQAHHDAEFNGMALVLFALQFEHNSPYRKFCEARNVFPNSVTHWAQIPAVPTTAFKELDLTCLPPEACTNVFHSSGTTEQRPSRHFHSVESLAIYEASLWPWFQRHVLAESAIVNSQSPIANEQSAIRNPQSAIILTPPPAQAPHSSLVHMFEVVRNKLGVSPLAFLGEIDSFGSWKLDFDKVLVSLHESVVEGQPLVLLGTAFSFVHLIDHLVEKNLRFELPPGSRVMETGGYKGRSRSLPKAELHRLITERLGVPATDIVCEYGMSELSSQAYDLTDQKSEIKNQKLNRVFRFPPWARAQIISPETGREVAEDETGLARIFDLANVFSVMAIQTEDLGVRREEGFELVGRAEASEPRGCSLMIANCQ
jgi:hypothetical protein